MSYLVLARKYRPETFQTLLGQEHVTQTIVNAFKKGRVAHAYLFCGPRGVGKTTTARVLAKALNCLSKDDGNPCNACSNCQEITSSRSMDVIEIDGASNRGIDEIRNLRELIKYSPMNSQFKVFIIDEVHMLTQAAFNALLKTLEEPPEHVKFIFATTEANKVLPTIMSRCQRHDFHRISHDLIKSGLEKILEAENITIEEEVFALIGNNSDGSMRDALTLTDQLIAFCGNKITLKDAVEMLRIIPVDLFFEVTDSLKLKDRSALLKMLNQIYVNGFPLIDFIRGLNLHLLNLLISSVNEGDQILDMTTELKARYNETSSKWESRDIIRYLDQTTKMESELKYIEQPKLYIEVMMLKLIEMDSSVKITELINILSSSNSSFPSKVLENTNSSRISNAQKPEIANDVKNVDVKKIKDKKTSNEVAKENLDKILNNPIISKTEKNFNDNRSSDNVGKESPGESVNVTSVSLEEIIQNWETVVSKVAENGTSISTFLSHGTPIEVVGSKIIIGFPESNKFQVDVLKKNSRRIENSLATVFNEELRVDFIIKEVKSGSSSEAKEKNLVTKKMLKVFGGEMKH